MKSHVQAAGFVDLREYWDEAPVGTWNSGNSSSCRMELMVDNRLHQIGKCMAHGWLGFFDAMKHAMEPVYGSVKAVDDIIEEVKRDYVNPNYHEYNIM